MNNRRRFLLAGGTLLGAAGLGKVAGAAAVSAGSAASKDAGPAVDLNRKGMQLVITGSGSALPDPLRGGASCAVIVDGQILQFDCGRRVLENLMLVGINPLLIDHLFFTHLHFDHIADYDYFAICAWIAGRREMIGVHGPNGTMQMSTGAIRQMHAMDYEFVKTIIRNWPPQMAQRPVDEPPLQVRDVGPGVLLQTDTFKVTAVETRHLPDASMKSLGYRVDSKYGSVAISGDTAPTDSMRTLAQGVDVLVHECVTPDQGMTPGGKFSRAEFHDPKQRSERPQTGHTTPTQLGELAQASGVKQLIAYHLPPYTSVPAAIAMSSLYYGAVSPGPAIWSEYVFAIKKHYAGPLVMAEDRMVFDIGA